MVLTAMALAAALTQGPLAAPTNTSRLGADDPVLEVTIDSVAQEVVLRAGPFHIAAATMVPRGQMRSHSHDAHALTPIMRIDWPVEGWLRGFSLRLREADGTELPSAIIHHFVALNYERRQLVYPVIERLFAVGQETSDVLLPPIVGVPLDYGQSLGFYAMWSNTLGRDLSAYIELRVPYLSTTQEPQFEVLPLYLDVNNVIGGESSFDLHSGVNERAFEFEFETAGRIMMVGGHMHDYGEWVRLEDVETGEVLIEVKGELDDKGKTHGVERKIIGFGDDALHVEPGHRYRVVARYDYPESETLKDGAMAHMMGIFVPDDLSDFPELDRSADLYNLDFTNLPTGELHVDGAIGRHSRH
ncbi:MAG: hypothetical protein BMS9Abin29_0279 [Gemmatimonadota bacterium]|nr:MAG: hypothetical protein BMS9Abin29_0279 [Gemmatimonadota bacterium]